MCDIKCPKWKFVTLESLEKHKLDIKPVLYCKFCNNPSALLYLIHNYDGIERDYDYNCYDCNEEVAICYFCIKCYPNKNK